jgi:hypothetical protein
MSDDRLTPKLPDKIEKALRAFARAKDPAAKIRLHASLVSAILAAMEEARREGRLAEGYECPDCGSVYHHTSLCRALSLPQSPGSDARDDAPPLRVKCLVCETRQATRYARDQDDIGYALCAACRLDEEAP